jgi:hypothetical protein
LRIFQHDLAKYISFNNTNFRHQILLFLFFKITKRVDEFFEIQKYVFASVGLTLVLCQFSIDKVPEPSWADCVVHFDHPLHHLL